MNLLRDRAFWVGVALSVVTVVVCALMQAPT